MKNSTNNYINAPYIATDGSEWDISNEPVSGHNIGWWYSDGEVINTASSYAQAVELIEDRA